MVARIFINYRRDDSIGMAGRLHDRLSQTFGRKTLFMDVDHIPPGVDFVNHLNNQVAACDVFLAIIGPNWLNATNEKGERRLDATDDFVAIEIAAALARNIRVIPVLVDGARMPKAGDLPKSLKPLVRRQAIDLRHTHFGRDADALIEKIREAVTDKPARVGLWKVGAGVVAALLFLGGVGLFATGTPISLPWAVQPDTREQAEKERLAAAQAEEERKAKAAAEAEKERLAAAKAEEERKAKAAAEAEARAKAEQAEKERLAAAKAEEERKAKAAAEAEAKRKSEEAERQRLAALRAEEERKAKAEAEAAARRKAEEAEQQWVSALKAEQERRAKAEAALKAEQERRAALDAKQELVAPRQQTQPGAAALPAGVAQPALLGQYGDWGAYTAAPGGTKVCFALAKPKATKTDPAGRKRDPSYVFVSTRPAQGVKNEVSVIVGYPFKTGSDATAYVGNDVFAMYTTNDGAWIKNVAEEARLVNAMRRGGDLTVTGIAVQFKLTDQYSLKGLAQALDRIELECK
jgi:TIR domain/Invasion associated locus B (IalB) protein